MKLKALVRYRFLTGLMFGIVFLAEVNADFPKRSLFQKEDSVNNYRMLNPADDRPALALTVAGIVKMEEARKRLNNIDFYINREGPQLIVHLVNWYRYNPEDMTKTLFWNGDAGNGKDTVVLNCKPLFGYYNCNDPMYINWVLSFSKALGIDELNVDYEGGVDYLKKYNAYYKIRPWDSWFIDLLNCAEKFNMKISVMYEPKSIAGRLSFHNGENVESDLNDPAYTLEVLGMLKDDLRKICDRFTITKNENDEYIPNPAYKRVAGLPVIWVFGMSASGLTEEIWKQAIEELQAEGYMFVLVAKEETSSFNEVAQGMNPWLDQIFSGFRTNYSGLWNAAQKASADGNYFEARRSANQYIDEMTRRGLNVVAPVEDFQDSAHFSITPLAIGFQDAAVDAWGFRPPVYIESNDRTHTEPGKLFRTYFSAAQQSKNKWYLICSGDDIPERTYMLIPDEEFGFSGPYAIALMSAFLGKDPDLFRAIQITESYIKYKDKGIVPEGIQSILTEAKEILPDQLKIEINKMKK